MLTLKNIKPIQKKSKRNTVTQTGDQTFEVLSGNSGNTYFVTVLSDGSGAVCSCGWGQHRKSVAPQSGCNHVLSVYANQMGRSVSAWLDQSQAKKQHRPMTSIGDGVTLTTRQAEQPKAQKTEAQLLAELGF